MKAVLDTLLTVAVACVLFVLDLAFTILYYAILGLGVILLIKFVIVGWLV